MIQTQSNSSPGVKNRELSRRQKIGLNVSATLKIQQATGLSNTAIRRLILEGQRPTNPLIAAAWDDVVRELGLVKP